MQRKRSVVAGSGSAARWSGLAAVARERASEQSDKAASASDPSSAEPHLEQRSYLLRLAEVYEERARDGAAP